MLDSLGKPATGARLERMKRSPRYQGGVFHNTQPVPVGLQKGTAAPTMWEFLRGGKRRTPEAPLPVNPLAETLQAWATPPSSGLRATWLGHSTTLLEVDGLRILTDPMWSRRASPFKRAGPARFQPPPVPLDSIPEVDVVVISHDHYDHLDHGTIRALAKRDVPFVVALGVGAHLESWGIAADRIHELDWWETAELCGGRLKVTSTPSQHFSGRRISNRNSTLWTSYAIQGPRHNVFFSGDTGLTPEFTEVGARFGPFDLIMLEVGAHHPSWGHIHLGPENALKAFGMLGGGTLLPIHWGTFNLALHEWDAPVEALVAKRAEWPGKVVLPRLGEPIEPSHAPAVETWWRQVRQASVAKASKATARARGTT